MTKEVVTHENPQHAKEMIKEVISHGNPQHADELIAYLWLKRYGEDKFPGISKAPFRPITEKDNVSELKKRNDVVLLGLGGGPFDEHGTAGDKEKAKECCATLVAKYLGLDQDFAWGKTLKYVLHTDKNPPNLTLDLAPTVMRLQEQGFGLNAVLTYTEITMNASYEDQKKFSQTPLVNVEEEKITVNGQESFIAIAKTDDKNITRYMRLFGAAIIVVKNSSGHIQVITNNEYHLDVRDILRILRIWEQKKNDGAKVVDWNLLETEDVIPAVPQWYYHKDSNNILNGGTARPDTPVTKLSVTEIVSAVRISLGNSFNGHCHGHCNSTPKLKCGWYELGLMRCRRARYATESTKK